MMLKKVWDWLSSKLSSTPQGDRHQAEERWARLAATAHDRRGPGYHEEWTEEQKAVWAAFNERAAPRAERWAALSEDERAALKAEWDALPEDEKCWTTPPYDDEWRPWAGEWWGFRGLMTPPNRYVEEPDDDWDLDRAWARQQEEPFASHDPYVVAMNRAHDEMMLEAELAADDAMNAEWERIAEEDAAYHREWMEPVEKEEAAPPPAQDEMMLEAELAADDAMNAEWERKRIAEEGDWYECNNVQWSWCPVGDATPAQPGYVPTEEEIENEREALEMTRSSWLTHGGSQVTAFYALVAHFALDQMPPKARDEE